MTLWVLLVLTALASLAAIYAGQRRMIYPGAYHLRSRLKQTLDDLIWEPLIVETTDGLELTMLYAAPTLERAPTIAILHGNGNSIADFSWLGMNLHDKGWGAALLSYRGYPLNPGAPSEAGLMADARAQLSAVPRNGAPLVLYGSSLGSGVAARMAFEGFGDALVLESPFTTLADVVQTTSFAPVKWLLLDRFDTLSIAPNIRQPVLLIAGERDTVIPLELALRLQGAIGSRAELVIIRNRGHQPLEDLQTVILERFLEAMAANQLSQPLGGQDSG